MEYAISMAHNFKVKKINIEDGRANKSNINRTIIKIIIE